MHVCARVEHMCLYVLVVGAGVGEETRGYEATGTRARAAEGVYVCVCACVGVCLCVSMY